jgi:hypothetical protein
MTVIELHIPEELEPALQQIPGDVETYILDLIRRQLAMPQSATDEDVEMASAHDLSDDYLAPDELAYYLNLPNA